MPFIYFYIEWYSLKSRIYGLKKISKCVLFLSCWMSPTPFYYAFLIPMALIIIVNCIVFALVLKSLLNRPKGLQSNQSEAKQAMMNLKAALSIFILLGRLSLNPIFFNIISYHNDIISDHDIMPYIIFKGIIYSIK